MVFSSSIFLFVFLPILILFYWLLDKRYRNIVLLLDSSKYAMAHLLFIRYKNILLLLASLFFYSWGEPKNVLVMLASIVANYVLAIFLDKLRDRKPVKIMFIILAVAFNLALLFYFKYIDFFIRNVNTVFHASIPLKNIALPIGISFFTFQSLSYVVDVGLGKVPIQKDLLNLGLYISFFPQLIAGPIVRYTDIEKQLVSRTVNIQKFHDGCMRFAAGFSKKVLIADQLAPYADSIFAMHGGNTPLAVFGILAYTVQIYFDFSGYSDMAIGLGKMFGFEFMENFNHPYISKSIKEFWRRWHISLSQWFRDYVYIPLGGSRCSPFRSYCNLVVTFLLTGFWHGASWNFIFWGLYYAFFLVLERLWLGRRLEKFPAFVQHLYAVLVIIFGWIFFRETGLKNSLAYIRHMFLFTQTMWVDFIWIVDRKAVFCLLAGIVFSMPVRKALGRTKFAQIGGGVISDVSKLAIFVIAIAFLLGTGFSPFLYFRF